MRRRVRNIGIIGAVEDAAVEVGAGRLTLDAIAVRARVSRERPLFYFPGKEALLYSVLDRRFKKTGGSRQERRAILSEGPENEITACVLSSIEREYRTQKLPVALLAATADDPRLLLRYSEKYRRFLEEFRGQGLCFKGASTIMLVVKGVKLMEPLSLIPLTSESESGIIEEIIAFSKGGMRD